MPALYSTIVADPPWQYHNGTSIWGLAESHYPTMSVEEICALPVAKESAAADAHLYLWTTARFLRDAFDVMDAWGFTYRTFIAWVKPQMGMGRYFRVSSELVLFGTRGHQGVADRTLMNWFQAKRGRHSAKPWQFYDLVTKASPGPYLEIFGRCDAANQLPGTCQCSRCRLGWSMWGNEVSTAERASLTPSGCAPCALCWLTPNLTPNAVRAMRSMRRVTGQTGQNTFVSCRTCA